MTHTVRGRAAAHLLGPAAGGAGKLGADEVLGPDGARLRTPGKSVGIGAGRAPSDAGRAHLLGYRFISQCSPGSGIRRTAAFAAVDDARAPSWLAKASSAGRERVCMPVSFLGQSQSMDFQVQLLQYKACVKG